MSEIIGEMDQAIAWFKANGVYAHKDDGSVYIEVDNDSRYCISRNFKVFNVQVGSSEILYRSDLYKNELLKVK